MILNDFQGNRNFSNFGVKVERVDVLARDWSSKRMRLVDTYLFSSLHAL